jgi:hypothetical protein
MQRIGTKAEGYLLVEALRIDAILLVMKARTEDKESALFAQCHAIDMVQSFYSCYYIAYLYALQ